MGWRMYSPGISCLCNEEELRFLTPYSPLWKISLLWQLASFIVFFHALNFSPLQISPFWFRNHLAVLFLWHIAEWRRWAKWPAHWLETAGMQRPEGSWLSLQIGGEKRLYTPIGTCQKQMPKESPTQQRICVFFFSPQFQPREYFWSYRNVGSFEYVLGLAVSFGSCCMVCFSPRATIHSEILSVFREVSLHVCFESTLVSQRHPLQLNQFSDTPKS